MDTMNRDYRQMTSIIHYLNDRHDEQPSLEQLANVAGLSKAHFQRKFTDWVGVSPKSFIQHLTLTHARKELLRGESVSNTSYSVGLSGASRLHDLCISLESVTPGDIKNHGEKLKISYGIAQSPFGTCLVGMTPRGILLLEFVDGEIPAAVQGLRKHWHRATFIREDSLAQQALDEIFIQAGPSRPLHAYIRGSKFQLRVWRALLNIKPGMLVTYSELAGAIGAPGAARSVGNAVGSNPLAFLIPCHRVIPTIGALGGYRWGIGRKRVMIATELARLQ